MNGTLGNDYTDADNYHDLGGPVTTTPVFLVGTLIYTHVYTYTDEKWVGMTSAIADALRTHLSTVADDYQTVRKVKIGGGGYDIVATVVTYSGSAPP